MTVYCVSHKPVAIPESSFYKLIQVGNDESDFAALRDNVGDHIASKNSTFSELTAFYYLWKNRPTDIIGICHYRRFLLPPGLCAIDELAGSKPFADCATEGDGRGNYASGRVADREDLLKLLNSSDESESRFTELLEKHAILLPKRNALPEGDMIYQYTTSHPSSPMFALLQLLAERNHYLGKAAYEYFSRAGYAYWNNLFVTTWSVFDQYCEFLFGVLFELESRLNLPACPYQRRVYAFLSERLLNFWLWFNELSVAELDWCLIEDVQENDQEVHRNDPATQQIYNADWRARISLQQRQEILAGKTDMQPIGMKCA